MVRSHQARDLAPAINGLKTAEGLFAVDGDQRIVHWNDTAERLLGMRAADVVGRACHEVFAGRDAEGFPFCRANCAVTQKARRGRATEDYDVIVRRPDGREVRANVSIMLLKQPHEAPLVLHAFRDVTERRRVETFARRALESLREIDSSPKAQPEAEPDHDSPPPAPPLSPRETEVLGLMAAGLTTKQIAERLEVSPITARNHITHVITKLGARNRLQAVLYATRRRLV